jgi:hypothetical protein
MAAQSLWSATEGLRRHGPDWVEIAQRVYCFDPTTARRLTFIRWLRATGRLPGDDAALTGEESSWPRISGATCGARPPWTGA